MNEMDFHTDESIRGQLIHEENALGAGTEGEFSSPGVRCTSRLKGDAQS